MRLYQDFNKQYSHPVSEAHLNEIVTDPLEGVMSYSFAETYFFNPADPADPEGYQPGIINIESAEFHQEIEGITCYDVRNMM